MSILYSKEKIITIKCLVESNDDWSLITFDDDPNVKEEISYYAIPTEVISPAQGDPEKISELTDKFSKTFPKYSPKKFSVITEEYYNHYTFKFGTYYEGKRKELWKDAVELLYKKDYFRFIIDSSSGDGYFYDKNIKKIYRRFFIDEIISQIRMQEQRHKDKSRPLKEIFNCLKNNPQVFDLSLKEIPYYNRDNDGINEVPIFYFQPQDYNQFFEISNSRDSFESNEKIFKYLNIY